MNKLTTFFLLATIIVTPSQAAEIPVVWTEAFSEQQLARLKERGIELPSGQQGVKDKQLADFLSNTQLEMLRTRKAELQYQEQTPAEVYEKYQYITPKMAVAHVRKGLAHLKKVGIKQATIDFNKFPSKWFKGRKELQIALANCSNWSIEAFAIPAMGIKGILGKPGVLKKYRDRKGRAGAVDRCKRQNKKHPRGYFYPVYHTFAASSFVMDFVTFDIPFIGEDGDQYYIYTQLAYEIKNMQEAEELTLKYEQGEFD